MNHQFVLRSFFFLKVCLLLTLSIGCTVVYKIPMKEVEYPQKEKIDLAVQLQGIEKLREAKWEKHRMGDTYILPLGGVLALNAEKISKAVFRQVEVNHQSQSVSKDVDAVLIPAVVDIKRNRPATVFGDQTTSVIFEWKLQDRKGDTVWVDTIVGEGTSAMGQPLNDDSGKEQVEQLLDDLFLKSFEALTSSPEIQSFASTPQS